MAPREERPAGRRLPSKTTARIATSGPQPPAIASRRSFVKNTRAQRNLLHTWIILVVVKQHLVQIDRIDGRTEYLSEIPAAIRSRIESDLFSAYDRIRVFTLLSHGWGVRHVEAMLVTFALEKECSNRDINSLTACNRICAKMCSHSGEGSN